MASLVDTLGTEVTVVCAPMAGVAGWTTRLGSTTTPGRPTQPQSSLPLTQGEAVPQSSATAAMATARSCQAMPEPLKTRGRS